MASLAWLWDNEFLSDVRLQLCTVQPAPPDCEQPLRSPDASAGRKDDRGGPRGGVPQHSGRSSTSAAPARRDRDGHAAAASERSFHVGALVSAHSTAAIDDLSAALTFHVHANVLCSGSVYFRTRITQHLSSAGNGSALRYTDGSSDTPAAGATSAMGGTAATRLLLVEHVEDGEVDAMQAVLRHAYTGKLCGDGVNPEDMPVAVLMQMLVLADRFEMPLCMAHCCDALASRGAAEYDIAAINAALSDAPSLWHALPAYPTVAGAATERLLQLLGNADALRDASFAAADGAFGAAAGAGAAAAGAAWDAQLQQLSLPSLVVLLSSDRLAARSENSVLLLADQWVDGGARTCDAAVRRQVAATLRLCRLSPTFLFDVLPAVSWIQISPEERASLFQFVAAGALGGDSAGASPGGGANGAAQPDGPATGQTDRQQRLARRAGALAGPPAWYVTKPRATPPGPAHLTFTWELSREELKQLLKETRTNPQGIKFSRRRHLNGFTLDLFLTTVVAEGHQGAYVGYTVCADLAGVPSHGIHVSVRGSIACAGGQPAKQWGEARVSESEELAGCCTLFEAPCPGLLDVGSWGKYLVDGKMSVDCTVVSCQ